ncbi:hypothetical protein [Wohlfahrtiimonas larvae]|uniref:Uncharacterized protein n=1 Tax=Wohlfahrtiimonas larvae TaxID=1157986 RepID=A0ABP9MYN7_9GAMM|nr:hypothetical protein [Wohlfahrtiimonas larvae]
MTAQDIFMRCMQKKDGEIIAKKLAKLYVLIHLKLDYQGYITQEQDSIFLELAQRFTTHIESDLTKTVGHHAAILSALFLSDDESEII